MEHCNESVCSKMAAKRRRAVQKELTSFFGFSQSRSKKTKGKFKILLCLDIYSPECNELIESAVLLWNNKKNRRKLPPKVPVETESTVFVAVPHSVDSACQTEACETESTLEDSFLDQQSISDESDVILALGLSREDSECDSNFYSDPEFD